jgi:hypothetical protein
MDMRYLFIRYCQSGIFEEFYEFYERHEFYPQGYYKLAAEKRAAREKGTSEAFEKFFPELVADVEAVEAVFGNGKQSLLYKAYSVIKREDRTKLEHINHFPGLYGNKELFEVLNRLFKRLKSSKWSIEFEEEDGFLYVVRN